MAEVTQGEATPVAAPVDAAIAAPAPEGAIEAPVTETEKPTPPPEKTFTQKELDRIVARERREYQKLSREAEERAYERYRREHADTAKPEQPKGKPLAKDYANPDDWAVAVADWTFEQREAKAKAEREKSSREQEDSRVHETRARTAFEKIIAPGREKHEDFDEVVLADDAPITDVMIAAAARLKDGATLLYQIAQDRKEALRIARLPDIEQAWEIKAYESKLSAPPKPTNAPPPIVPGGTKTAVEKDPSKMTDPEFDEWRKRQKAQRGNR